MDTVRFRQRIRQRIRQRRRADGRLRGLLRSTELRARVQRPKTRKGCRARVGPGLVGLFLVNTLQPDTGSHFASPAMGVRVASAYVLDDTVAARPAAKKSYRGRSKSVPLTSATDNTNNRQETKRLGNPKKSGYSDNPVTLKASETKIQTKSSSESSAEIKLPGGNSTSPERKGGEGNGQLQGSMPSKPSQEKADKKKNPLSFYNERLGAQASKFELDLSPTSRGPQPSRSIRTLRGDLAKKVEPAFKKFIRFLVTGGIYSETRIKTKASIASKVERKKSVANASQIWDILAGVIAPSDALTIGAISERIFRAHQEGFIEIEAVKDRLFDGPREKYPAQYYHIRFTNKGLKKWGGGMAPTKKHERLSVELQLTMKNIWDYKKEQDSNYRKARDGQEQVDNDTEKQLDHTRNQAFPGFRETLANLDNALRNGTLVTEAKIVSFLEGLSRRRVGKSSVVKALTELELDAQASEK